MTPALFPPAVVAAAQDPVVLAHGGGVPEAAMIGLPVLVLVVFAVLERRARRRERGDGDDG